MFPLAFGFGSPADIGVILVLALIIFGPKKLPEIGKQLGQAMREVRKVTDELTGAVHSVHQEVESAYKPVLTPPTDYTNNPYQPTSSVTVEKAMRHRDFQAPSTEASENLMAPTILPAPHAEMPATDNEEVKGH